MAEKNTAADNESVISVRMPRLIMKQQTGHPLGQAINRFFSRTVDIAWACSVAVPNAQNAQIRLLRKIARRQKELAAVVQTTVGSQQAEATAAMLANERGIDTVAHSRMPQVILSGLFIELFCEFDNFVGEFIRGIAQLDESRFYHLKREITIGELKGLSTIDELRDDLLEKEIESLRRESYPKQFQTLEKEYELTLTKFDEWAAFVESSQRRNLFTHAGGVVSDQYRQVCVANGNSEKDLPPRGTSLTLDATYFFEAHRVVERTGVMLGFTLWRKLFPQDAGTTDTHLNEFIYERLRQEDFQSALRYCEFGLSQSFVRLSSGAARRVRIINKAIALQRLGGEQESLDLLRHEDWSGTVRDFSLALAVLRDEYEHAAALMKKIGKEGEFVSEYAYRNWPLFWKFRKSPHFLGAYADIYGYSFSSSVASTVSEQEAAEVAPVMNAGDTAGVAKTTDASASHQPNSARGREAGARRKARAASSSKDSTERGISGKSRSLRPSSAPVRR